MESTILIQQLWRVLEEWWWILPPIIFYRPFLFLWLWWRREECAKKKKMVILEIRMPKDITKPLRAMEQVFSSFWGNVYSPPDWWKKWIDGETLPSFSLEIVGFGGSEIRFYIRALSTDRNAIESALYSQYPNTEILEVQDYTKNVPKDIPNKNWDMWGCDFQLIRDDVYPIKTYSKFFEPMGERIAKEEKRIDPLNTLLEGMAKLSPGEQLWVQIIAIPIGNKENNYIDRGRAVVDKLLKRPGKPVAKPIIQEAIEILATGKPSSSSKDTSKEAIPPEMKLSSGEKSVVDAIENKISKYGFASNIRFIYLGKRDVFFKPQIKLAFAFFSQFGTANLNGTKPRKETSCTISKNWFLLKNLFLKRRTYLRKRKMFRNYIRRVPPFFPRPGGVYVLDSEELATLYHFPGVAVAPSPIVSRIRIKRGEPPRGLPIE